MLGNNGFVTECSENPGPPLSERGCLDGEQSASFAVGLGVRKGRVMSP